MANESGNIGLIGKLNSNLKALLQGAIDMHIHVFPGHVRYTSVDVLEAAQQASTVGMRAIVLKDNYYPSNCCSYLASQLFPNLKVYGGIVLNKTVGGVNPLTLKTSLQYGGGLKLVWMPTTSSVNHLKYFGHPNPETGLSILKNGAITHETREVLKLIAGNNLVLASGHLSLPETEALVDAAVQEGIKKIVINHPELCITEMEPAVQKKLADAGAYIEYNFIGTLPAITIPHLRSEWGMGGKPVAFRQVKVETIVQGIKTVGAERCILATDFGHHLAPPPVEGMRMFIGTLMAMGITEEEVRQMVKTNPAKLLDLYT